MGGGVELIGQTLADKSQVAFLISESQRNSALSDGRVLTGRTTWSFFFSVKVESRSPTKTMGFSI